MIEENSLSLKNSVADDDKIRVVTSGGLSQSIEVGNLKNSLSVADLPDRVETLETKANNNDSAHITMSDDIALLKSTVGEEEVEGQTVTSTGLFQKINEVRSDLATLHLGEINRLDGELDNIRSDITSINGTNGRLDRIDGENGRLEVLESNVTNLATTKLDQSAFQDAVAAGFKVIGKTPASASAVGQPGEVCWDAEYLYVCVATNTWKRTSLESW